MGIEKTHKNLSTSLLQKDDFSTETPNNIHLKISNNNQAEKYNESTSLLLFTLATTCYGISNFQLKYIQYLFGETYDLYSFGVWRSIAFIFLIKQIINYKKIEIIPLANMEKQTLIWLAVRTIGQFFSLQFFVASMDNLRVGTANCFVAMNPAAVLIFSTFFLNEKFHWRYPIGIAICFSGVLIILSNELNGNISNYIDFDYVNFTNSSSSNENQLTFNNISVSNNNNFGNEKNDVGSYGKILLGVFWGSLNLITVAMLFVSSKFLNKANIGQENQCYYIGTSNAACFFLFSVLNGKLNFSPFFVFISATNAIIFLAATFINILALNGVDLNKTTPLNYISIVVSTILSCFILKEPLYFTDVLGSLIILGYNVYNSRFPVKD